MEDTAAEEEETEKSQPLPLGVKTQGSAAGEKTVGSAAQAPEAGRTQKADASNMTGYKNWSTPGKQGVSLNTIWLLLTSPKYKNKECSKYNWRKSDKERTSESGSIEFRWLDRRCWCIN